MLKKTGPILIEIFSASGKSNHDKGKDIFSTGIRFANASDNSGLVLLQIESWVDYNKT